MKAIMIMVGAMGAIYAIFALISLSTGWNAANTIAVKVVPVCLGLLACVVCYGSATVRETDTPEN